MHDVTISELTNLSSQGKTMMFMSRENDQCGKTSALGFVKLTVLHSPTLPGYFATDQINKHVTVFQRISQFHPNQLTIIANSSNKMGLTDTQHEMIKKYNFFYLTLVDANTVLNTNFFISYTESKRSCM